MPSGLAAMCLPYGAGDAIARYGRCQREARDARDERRLQRGALCVAESSAESRSSPSFVSRLTASMKRLDLPGSCSIRIADRVLDFAIRALLNRIDGRLQTVSKTGADLRVLVRRREELETRFNLLIRGAKQRIGARRRLVTLVQRFRVRFPCATANMLISRVFGEPQRASPNCLQERWLGKAFGERKRRPMVRLQPR